MQALQRDIRLNAIDLDRDDVIAVEVVFPHDTFLGDREAFYVIGGDDGETVGINDEYVIDDGVATPVAVREISDTRAVLHFAMGDIHFPPRYVRGGRGHAGTRRVPQGGRSTRSRAPTGTPTS